MKDILQLAQLLKKDRQGFVFIFTGYVEGCHHNSIQSLFNMGIFVVAILFLLEWDSLQMNSAPDTQGRNFESVISQHMLQIKIMSSS